MATASNIMLYRYSPENMDEAILRKLFVGRGKLLKSIFKEIEDSARKKTPRFFLIVGPRGIGKSHFLVLLYHEIKNKLGSMLIPIKLREEEYSVYRASDLFLRILEEKKEDTKEILSLANEDEILHAAIEKLKLISKRDGKRFIIFIENLHELFRQLDEEELKKLRSIFQKNDFFSVVASAPMIFPDISEHDEPFYNFFQIHYLNEFSLDEIKDLIRKIAEAENNKDFLADFKKYEPKIHGLAHLTGGSPRLVILFYEMITRGELENIENAFLKIIDEHTPYYQEIFQLLTGQKRRIFDAVISSETPVTPKQISKETRLDLPTVTTQLRRLETDGYVISRPMGRYTKYEVRERLFRLWREMRQPLGRKRVKILLEFLQYWYTPEERKELFKAKFQLFEAGERNVIKDLCYYAEIQSHDYKAEALLMLTPKLIQLGELEEATYEIQQMKETAAKYNDKKLESEIPLHEGLLLVSEERYEDAMKIFNTILDINPKNELALAAKGAISVTLGMYEDSLETLNRALEINQKNEIVLLNKGYAFENLGRKEEALEVFNKILMINPKNEKALASKGFALLNLCKFNEAFDVSSETLKINSNNEKALETKGIVLLSLSKYEEALEVFNKILLINPKNQIAYFAKCLTLFKTGRKDEALETFKTIIEMQLISEEILVLIYKGLVFFGMNKEALDALNIILEINPKNEFALTKKGDILMHLGRHEEAFQLYDIASKVNPKNESAFSMKGNALISLGRYAEAFENFNNALEIDPTNENALLKRSVALLALKRYSEAMEAVMNAKDRITSEYYKVYGNLILIYSLISLDKKMEAIIEVEKIQNRVFKIAPDLNEIFIDICFNIALSELEDGNPGNGTKLIKMAFNAGSKLKSDKITAMVMKFLNAASESGLQVIKIAIDEIIKMQEDGYQELLRPIIKAVEIIETKDIQKYYDLQIEEKEIVADIVKKITKSDDLLPEEIKRRETRLTDYATT